MRLKLLKTVTQLAMVGFLASVCSVAHAYGGGETYYVAVKPVHYGSYHQHGHITHTHYNAHQLHTHQAAMQKHYHPENAYARSTYHAHHDAYELHQHPVAGHYKKHHYPAKPYTAVKHPAHSSGHMH